MIQINEKKNPTTSVKCILYDIELCICIKGNKESFVYFDGFYGASTQYRSDYAENTVTVHFISETMVTL